MKTIKVKCPAKINLSLKVLNKRDDGFHNIESIMQTINLYDYLYITVSDCDKNEIILSGNTNEIPYDKTNLVYKAAELFLKSTKISHKKIEIYIEKNIPISAGLAGGSTDAAGTVLALNNYFSTPCDTPDDLCAKLGSDLNVCLHGGRILAKGRGEIIQQLPFENFNVSLIKPLKLGISAKEAYTKFSLKQKDPKQNLYKNDLEWAIIDDYKQLQYIKQKYPHSVMTGSGSTYFTIDKEFEQEENYWVKNNLKSVNEGIVIETTL